jgi:hypothetical protein
VVAREKAQFYVLVCGMRVLMRYCRAMSPERFAAIFESHYNRDDVPVLLVGMIYISPLLGTQVRE